MSSREGGPAEISAALQALRLAATLLIVLGHASIPYITVPLRTTIWAVYDVGCHVAFDYFCYWVNGAVLPLFFLLAGISATPACEAHGPIRFLARRGRRLLTPLLLGCVTVLPFTYIVWGYAMLITERSTMTELLRLRFSPQIQPHLFGFMHLWFLAYLFVICLAWSGIWAAGQSRAAQHLMSTMRRDWPARLLASRWKPLMLALPTWLIFTFDADTFLTAPNKILPEAGKLLHFGLCFAVGGWIAKLRNPRQRLSAYSGWYLAIGCGLFIAVVPLVRQHLAEPLAGMNRLMLVSMCAVFTWCTLFGLLGQAARIRRLPASLRFLSEASFWTYFFHLPVVVLLEIILLSFPWNPAVKFATAALIAIGLSLVSYRLLVRYSLIGEMINGARKRSLARWPLARELGWIGTACAALTIAAGSAWYWRAYLFENNFHEVISGQVYRSARLTSAGLERLIERHGLRCVISLVGGGDNPWFIEQQQVCGRHDVEIRSLWLDIEQLPERDQLEELIRLLDTCPRPVLIEGERGIGHAGFAAALTLLLNGDAPDIAVEQLSAPYGQLNGPAHCDLGRFVLTYGNWLAAEHVSHDPDQFRAWVATGQLKKSCRQASPADRFSLARVGAPRFATVLERDELAGTRPGDAAREHQPVRITRMPATPDR